MIYIYKIKKSNKNKFLNNVIIDLWWNTVVHSRIKILSFYYANLSMESIYLMSYNRKVFIYFIKFNYLNYRYIEFLRIKILYSNMYIVSWIYE